MQKIRFFIFAISLTFFFFFLIQSSLSAEPELGGGRISLIQGQGFIQAKDGEEWIEASVNFPVMEGDRIRTEKDGRVEIQFKNSTYVRMGEESQVDIIALNSNNEKEIIHLNLLEGKIFVNHQLSPVQDSSFYIDLPYGFLTVHEKSKFRVDLHPSEAKISVLEGSVEFKGYNRPILLTRGKTFILSGSGYTEVGQLYRGDEWDRWNEARDNELGQRRYAQRYLPNELEPWGYEMEDQGRWIYTPEYRYVWLPSVVVGWAPFRHGYWTWRRGIYCWIPYEPWGWIPFHYGRWVHIHIHGWVWVPPIRQALFWHPGAVGWYVGPTHISWVPLAPGEVYYGYGYYGPYTVNTTRVNINIQKNVYTNAQVKDAVVTVHKDSFFKGNQLKVVQMENPFLCSAKVSVPSAEKPVFLEGKRATTRPPKKSVEKVQIEGKPSLKELGKDSSSVNRGPEFIGQKQITLSPEKKTINETARNRVEKMERLNGQIDPTQRNLVKRESTLVPTRERVKGENQAPKQEENKNRNTPIVPPGIVKIPDEKEPKYSQVVPEQNVSRDINQNRFERKGQTNSFQSFPNPQEGKTFSGMPSLPEVRPSPAPASKGQVIQNSGGTRGGFLGSSIRRPFH
jgi:hypothetical protein